MVGKQVTINQDIRSVNGNVEVAEESRIQGKISTINGGIELNKAWIKQDLETRQGDILLDQGTELKGDIVIRGNSQKKNRPLTIQILNGSKVEGDIRVTNPDRQVEVYVSTDSEIQGKIIHAKVVKDS
jgi:DUF4097 and DUF4098 domain-containing protein YvlB